MRLAAALLWMTVTACGDSSGGSESPAPETPEENPAPPPEPIEPLGQARHALVSQLSLQDVARLQGYADHVDGRSDQVFAKMGDSATVSRAFLECFAGDETQFGDHTALSDTVDFFRSGNAGGRNPFRRQSVAAEVGWSARQLLLGQPPPILQEVQAINPRFAFVLSGGNDVEGREPRRYANRMTRIVDRLTTRGVIPILGSITPRNDDPVADAWVRRYNAVNRAIAQGRGVPYIDFHQALAALPRRGLARDGVHPNVYTADHATHPCDLSDEGLRFGQNTRNLLALQMLDRLRRRLLAGETSTDPEPEVAAGTTDDPIVIGAVPFSFYGDTRQAPQDVLDRYPGCDPAVDESGGEFVFRFAITERTSLRFWAYGPLGADVDVHVLRASSSLECLARDDEEVVHELSPGSYLVTVDTFVSEDGEAEPGEFILTVDLSDPPAWTPAPSE